MFKNHDMGSFYFIFQSFCKIKFDFFLQIKDSTFLEGSGILPKKKQQQKKTTR